MHVLSTALYSNKEYAMPEKTCNEGSSVSFTGILKNRVATEIDDNSDGMIIGKYTDAKFGFDAYVYAADKGSTEYKVKVDYYDGRSETRELNIEKVDASNCDIIDLFAKMKYIENTKGIDNPMSNHVLAHFYMEHRTPNANSDTNMNWIDMFREQLELEKKDGDYLAAQKLEKLLLYL